MGWNQSTISGCRYFKTVCSFAVVMTFFLNGCTTILVDDPVNSVPDNSARCEGSVWSNDSTVSFVPVPVFAFAVPHYDMYEIKAEDYLQQCGPSWQLRNRHVIVSRNACIPAGLSRLITLGVWQWCPAHVAWTADVVRQDLETD